MGFPDTMHRAVRQTELLGQIPRTPVSHPGRWRFQRHGHHLGGLSGLDGAGTAASGSIRQTGQAGFGKATPDAAHLDGGVTGPSGHFGARDMISDQQHGSCTPAESGGARRGPLQSLQFPSVAWRQDNGTRMVGHDSSRKGSMHGLYINITSDTTHWCTLDQHHIAMLYWNLSTSRHPIRNHQGLVRQLLDCLDDSSLCFQKVSTNST